LGSIGLREQQLGKSTRSKETTTVGVKKWKLKVDLTKPIRLKNGTGDQGNLKAKTA